MSEWTVRLRIKPIVAGVLAAIPPVVLFLLNYRREARIFFYFARFELYEHRKAAFFYVGLLLLIVAISWAGVWRAKGAVVARLLLRMMMRRVAFQVLHRNAFLSMALLGLLLAVSAIHLRLHYKLFSEVAFPLGAKKSFVAGDYSRARAICETYLQLYPQRREGGAVEDPVCRSITNFSAATGLALKYVRSQGASGPPGGPVVSGAPEARAAAIEVLQRFSGE